MNGGDAPPLKPILKPARKASNINWNIHTTQISPKGNGDELDSWGVPSGTDNQFDPFDDPGSANRRNPFDDQRLVNTVWTHLSDDDSDDDDSVFR